MIRCSAEERSLARANLYRLLALVFSYPTSDVNEQRTALLPHAIAAADLLDGDIRHGVAALAAALTDWLPPELEHVFQSTFSITYSDECPLWETAFSARQIFEQNAQLADIAGFYRAFGLDPAGERHDHLALELEFMFLLALKEAHARERGEAEHVRICRDAQRSFLRDHLARWAPVIGRRTALTGATSAYGAAGDLLVAFSSWEERFLRLGTVRRYRDEPVLIADEPGDLSCPMAELPSAEAANLPLFESREEAERVLAAHS
ncbi:MAG: molecular chaperone TorD family protein [Dehalococcoidia bacterium]